MPFACDFTNEFGSHPCYGGEEEEVRRQPEVSEQFQKRGNPCVDSQSSGGHNPRKVLFHVDRNTEMCHVNPRDTSRRCSMATLSHVSSVATHFFASAARAFRSIGSLISFE